MVHGDHPHIGWHDITPQEHPTMRITRKQTYSALAGIGILLGAAGVAGAATGTTNPSTAPIAQATAPTVNPDDADGGIDQGEEADGAEQDEVTDPAYTSSITVADGGDGADGTSETDESTQLAGLATITAEQAGQAALAAQPGTVVDVNLENENGNVVYSVIVDTGSGSVDVKIDAGNAGVLADEADDHEGERQDGAGDDAAEAAETEAADD
jgi:uncharacterized membrane protein YkoI